MYMYIPISLSNFIQEARQPALDQTLSVGHAAHLPIHVPWEEEIVIMTQNAMGQPPVEITIARRNLDIQVGQQLQIVAPIA